MFDTFLGRPTSSRHRCYPIRDIIVVTFLLFYPRRPISTRWLQRMVQSYSPAIRASAQVMSLTASAVSAVTGPYGVCSYVHSVLWPGSPYLYFDAKLDGFADFRRKSPA